MYIAMTPGHALKLQVYNLVVEDQEYSYKQVWVPFDESALARTDQLLG